MRHETIPDLIKIVHAAACQPCMSSARCWRCFCTHQPSCLAQLAELHPVIALLIPAQAPLPLGCLSFLFLSNPQHVSSSPCLGLLFDKPSILCLKHMHMVCRARMWGGVGSIVPMWLNFGCYCRHLALDATTGLDPPHIAMRPLEGPGGIHEFIPGYPLWGPFFASMANLGYTNKNLVRQD